MGRADVLAPDTKNLMHPMLAKKRSPPKRKTMKEHLKVPNNVKGSS